MKADTETVETVVRGQGDLYPWRFKRGESGNPRGRPRLTPAERAQRQEQKRLAREIALRQLDVALLTRQHAETAVSVLGKIIRSTKADDVVKLKAIGELFDRAFGKPTETSLAVTANANVMTAEQRDQVQARAGAALERLRLAYAPTLPGREEEPSND